MKNQKEKSIPFTIATERIKYLGINLPKTKELYAENCKTLMKEIKDDINRWRDISCSWMMVLVVKNPPANAEDIEIQVISVYDFVSCNFAKFTD